MRELHPDTFILFRVFKNSVQAIMAWTFHRVCLAGLGIAV